MLDDFESAAIDERLRATLRFLAKVSLRPDEVGPDDVPREVAREALLDALYVATYFNLITRLADAFAFTPISEHLGREGLLAHEAKFLERGYV